MEQNEPKFKIGDLVKIRYSGIIHTIIDYTVIDGEYLYVLNNEYAYLENRLERVSEKDDDEIKEIADNMEQNKFNIGDKVKIINSQDSLIIMKDCIGEIHEIISFHDSVSGYWYDLDNNDYSWREEWLEPISEEKIPTTMEEISNARFGPNRGQITEESEKAYIESLENIEKALETKELNLCELLKGHEGETFYSPAYGDVIFERITTDSGTHIIVFNYGGTYNSCVYRDGKMNSHGECLLFPSKDQRDWNKWAEEQKPKTPKIWSELVKDKVGYCTLNLCDSIKSNPNYFGTPIEKSILALLKIHQLIEVSYGGNITNEEWQEPGISKYVVTCYSNGIDTNRSCNIKYHIAFRTEAQRDEFLSYPENVQLVKDFYMI